MSSIQVADQTFIAGAPRAVAAELARPGRWRHWWPGLTLSVREDRGEKGIRWTVSGSVTGTMEVWLQPHDDGVIVHYFLHAEPTVHTSPHKLFRTSHSHRVAGRTMAFELKDRIEAGRPPGTPARSMTAITETGRHTA